MQTLFNLDLYDRHAEEVKAECMVPRDGDISIVRDLNYGQYTFYLFAKNKWYRQMYIYLEPEQLQALISTFGFEYGYDSCEDCENRSYEPERQEN